MFEYIWIGFLGWVLFLAVSLLLFCVAGVFIGLINGEGLGYIYRVFRGDYYDPDEPYDHFDHGW